jgi:hypothetical protein
MSLPINSVAIRKFFSRAFANAEAVDSLWWAAVDSQDADFATALNQCKARLEAISTAAGSLRYSLTQSQRFVATAGQTSFLMASTYDHVNDLVCAYTNSGSGTILDRIDDSLITRTDDTHVTLPAQALNAVVIIDIRSVGNGTSQLASTSVGQGADLVGYSNPNGLSTSINVGAALAELFADINSASFLAGILGTTAFIKKDGTVAFTGNQDMGGHKLTGLGAGSAGSNDAARMVDISAATLFASLTALLDANFLLLSGGTMVGNIAMNGNKVSGAAAGSANGDYATIEQIPNLVGAGKNAIINGSGLVGNGSDYAATVPGTFAYGKVETWKGALGGATVAGLLTQVGLAGVGITGYSIRWSAVTTTGAGTVTYRTFLESRDAARFYNQTASLGFKVLQSSGANNTVVANIYKANALNDFSAMTLIAASPPTTVPSATPTTVQMPSVAMGNCVAGVCVEIVFTVGAVTAANYDLTDVQLEIGSFCSGIELEAVTVTSQKCRRYFQRFAFIQATASYGFGLAQSGTKVQIALQLPVQMRAIPTLSVANVTHLQVNDGTTATSLTALALFPTCCTYDSVLFDATVAAGLTAWRPYFMNSADAQPLIDLDARF